MITSAVLPQPASTYQLLLDAAHTWPHRAATHWIPNPGDYTRSLSWTFAELAGTVTRLANALTALGVRRCDAVRSMRDAVRALRALEKAAAA